MPASKESDTTMAQILKNLQDANREIGRLEQLCRLSEAIIPDMADSIRKDEREQILKRLRGKFQCDGVKAIIDLDIVYAVVRGEYDAAD